MGTDIHIAVEAYMPHSGWTVIDKYTYYNYNGEQKLYRNPIYDGRDYDLFSVLQDEMDGSSISLFSNDSLNIHRGIPDDYDDKHLKGFVARHKEFGFFGAAWVTLDELYRFWLDNSFVKKQYAKKFNEDDDEEDKDNYDKNLEYWRESIDNFKSFVDNIKSLYADFLRTTQYVIDFEKFADLSKCRIIYYFDC